MKRVTIIATSLSEDSKSQVLARNFEELLNKDGVECERFDLREMDLPFAGPAKSWESVDAKKLADSVGKSSHVVFAVPIYCYDVNSAAKNVIELIGRSFSKKVIGFICSAGGSNSYMAVLGLANHLMLDFRSIIVPRFLYVDGDSWVDENSLGPEIRDRMERLRDDMREIQVGGS